ncbi:MAG TPA: hypothetical protein VFJ43_09795, partial [Bacteroidia bacterium]|nr:hypothetical protein [Bacteroidia bacterium]
FYFRDPAKYHWRPYIFANGGFEMLTGHDKVGNNAGTTYSSNGFRGYAGIGEAWFFSDHAAFDMRLHLIDFSYSTAVFAPTIYIGIQAHFHHE